MKVKIIEKASPSDKKKNHTTIRLYVSQQGQNPKVISLGISIPLEHWDDKPTAWVSKKNPQAKQLNYSISNALSKAQKIIFEHEELNNEYLSVGEFYELYNSDTEKNNLTLVDCIEKYIQYTESRQRSPSTIQTYRDQLSIIQQNFKKGKITGLNTSTPYLSFIQALRNKGNKNNYIRILLNLIKRSFLLGIRQKTIKNTSLLLHLDEVFKMVEQERPMEKNFLTVEDFERFDKESRLAYPKFRKRLDMLNMIFYTGMGFAEVYNLDYNMISNIQIAGETCTIIKFARQKSDTPVTVIVPDILIEKNIINPTKQPKSGKVFNINYEQLSYALNKFNELTDVYVTSHSFRISFATHADMNGGNPLSIQLALGHRTSTMTEYYSKRNPIGRAVQLTKIVNSYTAKNKTNNSNMEATNLQIQSEKAIETTKHLMKLVRSKVAIGKTKYGSLRATSEALKKAGIVIDFTSLSKFINGDYELDMDKIVQMLYHFGYSLADIEKLALSELAELEKNKDNQEAS